MSRSVSSLPLIVLLAASAPIATAAPATQPAGGFELREWAVFILDASQNTVNPDGLVTSTLPSFAASRRDAANPPSHDASPVGIVRLIGNSEKPVDITVEASAGTFLSSWPPADKRSKQLLWRNAKLTAGTPAGQGIEAVPDDHWFHSLRSAESAYLSLERGPAERFLLYDVQMPYQSPLTVEIGKDHSIKVANSGHAALHHLTFYQPMEKSWSLGTVGDLPAAAAVPASRPSTVPAAVPASVFADSPATAPASTMPSTLPSTQPATLVTVTMTAASGPSDLTDPWKPVLQKLGVAEADSGVMVSILANTLRDSHKLTAVYLMDDGEFDRLLPLEVVPEPRAITRVGMVIVRNSDPSAGSDVDDLIAQLADPAWSRRNEAYQALAKAGASAVPKLRAAAKSKDVEVAWRAEKLVATIESGKPAGTN